MRPLGARYFQSQVLSFTSVHVLLKIHLAVLEQRHRIISAILGRVLKIGYLFLVCRLEYFNSMTVLL